MTTALFAGSFDPITVGHVDIARRALSFADDLVIAVGINPVKRYLFDLADRVDMVQRAVEELGVEGGARVRVVQMPGALLECARKVGASIIVKGVRSAADFDCEFPQAVVNRDLGGIETVLIPARPELSVVSSSMVRELLGLGLDISRYVPAAILPFMRDNGEVAEPRRSREK